MNGELLACTFLACTTLITLSWAWGWLALTVWGQWVALRREGPAALAPATGPGPAPDTDQPRGHA